MARVASARRIGIRDFGTALFFNGSSTKIEIPQIIPSGIMAISFWLKTRTTKQSMTICDTVVGGISNNCFNIAFDAAGAIYWGWRYDDSGAEKRRVTSLSTHKVDNAEWNFYTFCLDNIGGTHSMYINGVLKDTYSSTYTIGPVINSFKLGEFRLGGVPLLGILDNFKVFNRALTASEVQNMYYYGQDITGNSTLKLLFNEGSGTTAIDSSGNNYNGTISNGAYVTETPMKARSASARRIGIRDFISSLNFDGTTNISANSILTNFSTNSYSMTGWVQAPLVTLSPGVGIMGNSTSASNPYVYIALRTRLYNARYSDGTSDIAIINQATIPQKNHQWVHIASVWDASDNKIKFYLNGILTGTSAASTQYLDLNTDIFKVGQISGMSNFSGRMCNITVHRKALSITEIKNMYFNDDYTTDHMVLWWKLDENTGSIATDSSGNNNNGTIVNGTWSTDVPMKARSIA